MHGQMELEYKVVQTKVATSKNNVQRNKLA